MIITANDLKLAGIKKEDKRKKYKPRPHMKGNCHHTVHRYPYKGRIWSVPELLKIATNGIKRRHLHHRLYVKKMSVEEAITKPVRSR